MTSHLYSYVEPLNPNLVCCICQTAFTDPVTTRTCAHTFCRACITHALSICPQCPVDRSPLAVRDLSSASQVIRNMVDELVVECPNRLGCSHTPQRYLLDTHLREDCQHTEIQCPESGCNDVLLRKDIESHRCRTDDAASPHENTRKDIDSEELLSTTLCAACALDIPLDLLDDHQAECPFVSVHCTHASRGCAWTGHRADLYASHLPSCTYESIKGFFQIHDRQLSSLSEENAFLRHKVEALEGFVSIMQRELRFVKDALGPWYREQDDSRPHMASPVASPLLHDAFNLNTSLESDSPSPSYASSEADLLTPFFASLSLDPSSSSRPALAQPSHSIPRGSFLDPASPRGPFIDPTSPRSHPTQPLNTSIPATAHVAPLDLAAPLPDTLAGLRHSVFGLAGALDSATRRMEIASAAGEARMGEEVGAVKAVVHGLRMQVHSLMVDRNAQITSRFASGTDNQGTSGPSTPFTHAVLPPMRYMTYPFPHGPGSPPVNPKL